MDLCSIMEEPGSSDADSVFSQAYETGLSSPEDSFESVINSTTSASSTTKEFNHHVVTSSALPAESSSSSSSSPPTSTSSDSLADKTQFVEGLVDTALVIIQSIWPSATKGGSVEECRRMPLRRFVQETLKRSKTLYSTFQVALYYLIMIKPMIMASRDGANPAVGLNCGRRTFLASLMLASKYLQDRNYSIGAWSKISGLSTHELRFNEIEFLKAMDWNMHVPFDAYNRWSSVILTCAVTSHNITSHPLPLASGACAVSVTRKRKFINEDEGENEITKVVAV